MQYYQIVEQGSLQNEECLSFKSKKNRKKKVQISSKDEIRFKKIHYLQYEQISNLSNIQLQKDILSKELQIIHGLDNNNSIKNQNREKYRQMYYKFFQNVIPNPEKYVYDIPSTKEFQRHKIKYLTGNKYQQNLQSFQKPFIRVKYTERSANIVVYTVIIAMFELEITLLNIDSDANTQQIRIGKGSFGSVRVQSENNRMFAVKRQIFKNKCNLNEFRMMANKYEIEQAIIQLAIYKICSLLKIGPAAETDIGFDLICYRDCIEFQLELCLKIEFRHGIYVDKSKFQKQIKQSLFILHQFKIIHKDIKPANILFSIKYNKYVFTDFGISHPVIQQIGQYSKTFLQGTFEYISQEMGNIISGQMGWVHLFGNDIHALSVVLKKQMMDLKIAQGLKYFIYKYQKQLITNYQYQYLKLKYYCIKPNHQINHSLSYWKCMENKRKVELISIVSRSMDFDKIQTVYNQLSKLKQYEDYDLQSLRKQTISIKQINIYLRSQQEKYNLSQIYLKNNLRTYGYSQKVKTIIQNLKLEQKYPKTMQIIRKIKEKQYYPSETDQLFDSYNYYRRYSRKLKQEIIKYQKLNDKKSMFQNYILLLEYCNNQNEIDEIIENLQILKYKRTKIQKIKEKILINYRIKNKQYLEDFLEEMEINPRQKNSIIQQLKLNMQVGQIYHYLDKYQLALKYYFRAQKQYKYRSISPYLAQIYYRIGYTYSKICKYKQALNYFNISLNMKILLVGQDHPNVACLYQNFAYIYFEKGIYETALSYYIKSLNITMKYEEQQHETLSIIYNNIAMVYQRLDKYQMGLYNCNKILKIDESYFGKINPNLALTYNNIGAIYNQMENYNEALEYLNKSLKICIELYGQKYISFSAILFNIGLVYKKMGQYEIALNYFIKSLKINIQRFGRKHNKVALNYDNLGYTYLKLKKYQRALQILERNISTWNQIEEQQNINVAVTYSYITKVYQNRKQYKIALYYFEKAFKIDSIYFDPLHPYIAQSKNHIGQIYCILGRYDQALANYLDCLQIYKKLNDTRVANLYNNIGQVYFLKSESQIALDYYKRSIDLNIQNYGQQHQQIARTYNNIGRCKLIQGEFKKAHLYIYRSIKIRKKILGNNNPDLQDNYYVLFEFFSQKKENKKSILYLNMAFQVLLKSNQTNHQQYYDYLYSLSKILYKTNKYLECYFISKLFLQLFNKGITQNQREIKKVKKRIKLIRNMKQLYLNNCNINIKCLIILNQKYTKLTKHQLFKMLKAKKLLLSISEKYSGYINQRLNDDHQNKFKQLHIKCMIQICLCYKYLKYTFEAHKTLKQLLQQVANIQSKQELYRYLKQVIN